MDAIATVDVLTANNNDVNLVETRNVLFARLLNRRLVLIARDIVFSHQSFSACKDGGYRE